MTTKKGLGHFLTALKVSKTQKETHHCITTLEVTNRILKKDTITVLKFPIPKNDFITFLRLLKFLRRKKGCMAVLRLLEFLILNEKGLHDFLETLKGINFEK